jgi:hypothetical protein
MQYGLIVDIVFFCARYGYTGPDYAIKKGPQIMAVKAMLDRVADLPGQNSISKHGHSHDKEL